MTNGESTGSSSTVTSTDDTSTSSTSGESTTEGSTTESSEATGSSGDSTDGGTTEASSSEGDSSSGSTGAACMEDPTSANWSCLPEDEGPLLGVGTALVHVQVQDFQAGAISGASVKVCHPDDAACAEPLDEATSSATGDAPVTVPRDVKVFFDVAADGYVPTLFFPWDAPPQDDDEVMMYALLATSAEVEMAFEGTGAEPDPERGHLNVTVLDCSVAPMPGSGVAVEVDTADASTVVGPPTVEGGGAAYIGNVPPGPAVVRGEVVALCDAAMGEHSVHVRAGTISAVDLWPSPEQ